MKLLKLVLMATLLSGCAKGFRAGEIGDFKFIKSSSRDLIPSTDKIDSGCMSDSRYDACIYLKNPVAHTKAAVSGDADYVSRQTLGVKITDTDESGYLQNGHFRVLPVRGARVWLPDSSRKSLYTNAQSYVQQVMSYYWLTRAQAYLSGRVGTLPVEGKGVQVFVGAPQSGWAAKDKAIFLSNSSRADLSADVLLSLWGQAMAHFASSGAINSASDSTHVSCANDLRGCCVDKNGCSKALVSGVGDYVSLMVFADMPRIGEMLANSDSGQNLCGHARDVASFADLTATTVHTACAGRNGWAPSLGFLYASVWWQVRKTAADALSVDKLFVRHLKELTGTDTLVTAKSKILQLAPTYGADLQSLFTAEFTKRGL